jgi:hypothetical protein
MMIYILLVFVLINFILSVFMGIVLVRILEAVIAQGRIKPVQQPDARTRSGLPPGLVDVPPVYDIHGNIDDTHSLQDQTVKQL